MSAKRLAAATTGAVLACLWAVRPAGGNLGPFLVKYPGGDPAAKGVLARLDPTLKPAREMRLRVVKEDLTIEFRPDMIYGPSRQMPPLARVTAAYTIENPTGDEVQVDFGFPILKGIYVSPEAMVPTPDVHVRVDGKGLPVTVISNSTIYGIIRRQGREVIEKGIAADAELTGLVAAVRAARGVPAQQAAGSADEARERLAAHLTGTLKWNHRDAALMVEYAGLDLGSAERLHAFDRDPATMWGRQEEARKLAGENLGALAAIGEQKATQLLAQLAGKFDKAAAASYEAIFEAWGGDVRERSVDLATGQLRPREVTLEGGVPGGGSRYAPFITEPTVYARLDYLNEKAEITDAEKASCRAILKNLPVVFTFAPMNLLHYPVSFPAGKTQVVTVEYAQYAYIDTREPASYQLAYVLHPASLWDSFGPIRVEVRAPQGVNVAASVPLVSTNGTYDVSAGPYASPVGPAVADHKAESRRVVPYLIHAATLTEAKDRTGEMVVGLDMAGWRKLFPPAAPDKLEPTPTSALGTVVPKSSR